VARFAEPSSAPLARDLRRELSLVLKAFVVEQRVAGVAAAVVSEDGHWAAAAGRTGAGDRLTPRTSLMAASITKTFTAAEVLHLADTGRVDLDARLSTYVPLPVPDNGATVRQALAMRSGIRDHVTEASFEAMLREPDRHWTPEEALAGTPDQTDQPGAIFDYSNTNYILLGQLIEKITGKTYAQALRDDLLAPGDLTRVAVQDEERPPPPLGRPTDELAGSDPYVPSRAAGSYAWSAGGIAADVRSIARWGYLLYGGQVLPGTTVAAMLPAGEGDDYYGLGTDLRRGDVEYVGHPGDFPGYRTSLRVAREHSLSIAVVITGPGPGSDPDEVVDRLAAALFAASG
jgi:CubicO group peptidase (beta-lactamase class C family)